MGKLTSEQLGDMLDTARREAQPVAQLTKSLGTFSRSEAYAIQERQFALRTARGERQVGWKMGMTSEAKRKQMGLNSPLYGFLLEGMQVPDGGEFSMVGTIHPKIEPEIAFRVSRDLQGKVTRNEAAQACDGYAACLEILDSRYDRFEYFSMEDVIADNSSSSHFVLGPWRSFSPETKLNDLLMEMTVERSGGLKAYQKGFSQDISGDPMVSVVQLCALLAERDQVLKKGSVVLAGAATAAVALEPGMSVKLQIAGFAPLRVHVTGDKP